MYGFGGKQVGAEPVCDGLYFLREVGPKSDQTTGDEGRQRQSRGDGRQLLGNGVRWPETSEDLVKVAESELSLLRICLRRARCGHEGSGQMPSRGWDSASRRRRRTVLAKSGHAETQDTRVRQERRRGPWKAVQLAENS